MKKPLPPPAKKKSPGFAASILDGVGWVVREAALPVPDSLMNMSKKKKLKDMKKKK
jgi:hypothetical protein